MNPDRPLVTATRPSLAAKTTAVATPRPATEHSVLASFGDRIVGAVRRLAAGLKKTRIRRETMATLSALDDRLLADIGLERRQIGTVVEAALRAVETRGSVERPAARRITDGTERPAANDNESVAEDAFEAMARQWHERLPTKAPSRGHPLATPG